MDRQRLYNQQVTANPNQNIRQANIPSAPRVEGAGYGLLRAVGNAGGDVVKLVARDYAREWQGRVDDAVLRTNAEFERWKTEYMQTRQGVNALTAQEDFANKYAELSQQTVAEFGNQRGNEIYKRGLERELAKYGLYAVKAGGAYQIQQNEAWEKSQWDAQLSSFQKIVEDNPLDPDMISMEQDTLLRSWMAKNPGLDPGAMREKLRAMAANGRMNSLLARGSAGDMGALDDAERLLGKGSGGGISPGISAGPRGHTIAEDFHNPLNLKKVGGGSGRAAFRQFADDAEGFRGAYHQLKLYYNRDGLKTPRQMISKWAPKFENNHPEYFGTIKKHGIDIDAPIDMNDPGQASRLVKAMAAHEGPLGNRYSFEQIEGFLRGKQQGGSEPGGNTGQAETGAKYSGKGASLPGLSVSDQMVFRHKIEAMRKHNEQEAKKAQEQALFGDIRGMAAACGMLDLDQQKAAVLSQVDKIKDPEMRKKAISLASSELEFQKDLRKAKTSSVIYGAVQDMRAKGLSPTQAAEAVNGLNLNPEDTKRALEMYNGKLEENELNMRALSNLRLEIDKARRNGSPMTDDGIYRFAYDNRMTNAQIKEALSYRDKGGSIGEITQSELVTIWLELQGMKGKERKRDDAPSWLYAAVRQMVPDGKKPSRDELQHIVARAIVEGSAPGMFGLSATYQYGEALAKGKIKNWKSTDELQKEEDGDGSGY